MKRTKNNDEMRHYRKIGGGSLRLPGRLIKPNQEFWAHPSELPKSSKDVVLPLDEEASVPEKASIPVKKVEYTLKHRSGGFYHVYDANGKQLTEEAVKKDEAEEYIKSLKEG